MIMPSLAASKIIRYGCSCSSVLNLERNFLFMRFPACCIRSVAVGEFLPAHPLAWFPFPSLLNHCSHDLRFPVYPEWHPTSATRGSIHVQLTTQYVDPNRRDVGSLRPVDFD